MSSENLRLSSFSLFPFLSNHSLHARLSRVGATVPSEVGVVTEGVVSVINFEDFAEKDWSFLDSDNFSSEQNKLKVDRIISAGEIQATSRVMVSVGSDAFVDQLVESSPCSLLLVVHDSLFVLAGIKEKYDQVTCWQGELIYAPDKWAPLDVVFLYFLPAVPFNLGQVFEQLRNVFVQVQDWLSAILKERSFRETMATIPRCYNFGLA